MRNSGNRRSRVVALAIAAWLSVCGVAGAQTARARYETAAEREVEVRALLTTATEKSASAELVKQVSQVMTSFEIIVRRFPTSGYADNALWQAAGLADAAYQRFNRSDDRERALKFYRWLVEEYPTSTYVNQANAKIAGLTRGTTPAASDSCGRGHACRGDRRTGRDRTSRRARHPDHHSTRRAAECGAHHPGARSGSRLPRRAARRSVAAVL